jgi:hypothetical protein
MRYNAKNAGGATVHDLDRGGEMITQVMWIDDRTGTVCVASHKPIRLTATGEVRTRRHVFRAVWPIWAGQSVPVMFQCSGRLSRREPGR